MEPRDHDEHPRQETPASDESASESGVVGGGSQVIETDDPGVVSGTVVQADWKKQADRTIIIQTSRIREPNEADFVKPRDAGRGGKREDSKKTTADPNRGRDRREEPAGGDVRSPSMLMTGVVSGVIGLVVGMAGAWGYSHFFGSKQSESQQSASNNSEAEKGSKLSEKDADNGKLRQAEAAWQTAIKDLHQARESEKAARRSEDETKAILHFLERTLLSASRPGNVSMADAFWAGTGSPNQGMTLSKAVELTEARVAEAFADRPLAEASVREMLGLAYVNLGQPARAVSQYERALALREAIQGSGQAETAACRNQLAIANRLAGRVDEAGRLFDRNADSTSHADALTVRGSMLLLEKKPVEAELQLRQSLAIRQKRQPESWETFDTESTLGEALADQKKFAEAEPMLVSGYEGLKRLESKIPAREKLRLTNALERLVTFYEAWGQKDKAAKWRVELEQVRGAGKS